MAEKYYVLEIYSAYVLFIRKHYANNDAVVLARYSLHETSTKSVERHQRLLKNISPDILF